MKDHAVLLKKGADPFLTKVGTNKYFYITSGESDTELLSATTKTITGLASTPLKPIVWDKPPNASKNIWAPEAHIIDGRMYIYYAAGDIGSHRMHVLGVVDDKDLGGKYEYLGEIVTENHEWAIDGTVFQVDDKNFFIWSGWENNAENEQKLYISRMISPTNLENKRFCISRPDFEWERSEHHEQGTIKVNEGPAILRHDDRIWCVFSAAGSWTDDYCLGLIEFKGGDPLNPENWDKNPKPFFKKTNELFGPGHCSFSTDEDGQIRMLYHTAVRSGGGWDRQVRIAKVVFNQCGNPSIA